MNINPFESKAVEFVFQLPLDKAIENLRNGVGDPKQDHVQAERMVGSVTQGDSYIYRVVPRTRNSFRPTFYGSFSGNESETVLKGVITLNRVIQKFMYLWLGIVAVVAAVTLITILSNPAASWSSLLQIVVMFVGVFAMFVVLKNKCEPDVDWLKSNIANAIETGEHNN